MATDFFLRFVGGPLSAFFVWVCVVFLRPSGPYSCFLENIWISAFFIRFFRAGSFWNSFRVCALCYLCVYVCCVFIRLLVCTVCVV